MEFKLDKKTGYMYCLNPDHCVAKANWAKVRSGLSPEITPLD